MDEQITSMTPSGELDVAGMMLVKQLPIIEEQLHTLADQVRSRTAWACALACTPETVKDVKKVRAELNKEFRAAEAARKEIKSQVLAPYEQFEATYKECVAEPYRLADTRLKQMVDNVEFHLRDAKEKALRAYFADHAKAAGLDPSLWGFDRAGIQVNLSSSEAALKKQLKAWIQQRADDLAAISKLPDKDEVLAAYVRCMDMALAVSEVAARREAVEAARRQREEYEAQEAVRQAKAEEIAQAMPVEAPAPVPVQEAQEELLELHFTVRGTRTQLKALKQYLIDGGYDYE